MPKAMNFKANSVIYFQGDVSDRIYILKSGRVSLTSNDIETGQEIHDHIQTGEFFGVKSAVGKYPREEDAVVLSDSSVVVFSVAEFEQVVASNTRVIMKMLKVFSNQLRRIHAKVRSLLALEEQVGPEVGLFRIGEYYLRKKQYNEAAYAFRRFVELYPESSDVGQARDHLKTAEAYAEKYGHGKGPVVPGLGSGSGPSSGNGGGPRRQSATPNRGRSESGAVNPSALFQSGENLARKGNYEEAIGKFKSVAAESSDDEYTAKALYEIGKCLYNMERYEQAIKHLGTLVQKNPRMDNLADALYYVGESYRHMGDGNRAKGFFTKVLSLSNVSRELTPKVKRALESLEVG